MSFGHRVLFRGFAATQQPVQYSGQGLTDEAFARVESRDASLRDNYDRLPLEFPQHSQPPGGHIDRVEAVRKRLIYRRCDSQNGDRKVPILLIAPPFPRVANNVDGTTLCFLLKFEVHPSSIDCCSAFLTSFAGLRWIFFWVHGLLGTSPGSVNLNCANTSRC